MASCASEASSTCTSSLQRPSAPPPPPPESHLARGARRSQKPGGLDDEETPTGALNPGIAAAVLLLAASAGATGSSFPTTDQTVPSASADGPGETGKRITFLSACEEDRDSGEFWEGCLDLYVMAPDRTATEKLAELTAWTALSPNVIKVAFYRPDDNGDWELFVADVEGTYPTRIASTRRPVYPAWSLAGPTLAFANDLSDSR